MQDYLKGMGSHIMAIQGVIGETLQAQLSTEFAQSQWNSSQVRAPINSINIVLPTYPNAKSTESFKGDTIDGECERVEQSCLPEFVEEKSFLPK